MVSKIKFHGIHNDHHFSYGNDMHHASTLGKFRTTFVNEHGTIIDCLVPNVANVKSN